VSALAPTRRNFLAERANDNVPYLSRGEVLSCADVVNSNTGRALLELNEWAESCTARDRLRRDTERFADILEREGVQARLPVEMVAIGSATGQIDALDTYRNSNILPLVASRNRRALIRDLKWFLANHPKGAYARYGVITSGERVPLFGELRARVQLLHRKISKWASWSNKRFGIKVQHRQGEFTVDESLTFHPHVNVIYWPTKPLKKADWSKFLKETEQFFGAYWRDCGKIEDVNEVVKYITKGDDLQLLADSACLVEAWRDCGIPKDEILAEFVERLGKKGEGMPLELLSDASICMKAVEDRLQHAWRQGYSHPLVWLFYEMHGLHVAQSMGEFACERRKLRDGKLKIVSIWTPAGMKQRMVAKNSKTRSDHPPEVVENQVICVSLPQPRFTPWSEPIIYVNGYNPRPTTSNGRGGLELINRLKSEVAPIWQANGAPIASVAVRRAIMVSGIACEGLEGGEPRSGAAAQAEPGGAAAGEGGLYGSHQYENCPGSNRISLGSFGEYDPLSGEVFEKPPDRGKKYLATGERWFETFDDLLNHVFDMEEN
jgi:hypothetical protein